MQFTREFDREIYPLTVVVAAAEKYGDRLDIDVSLGGSSRAHITLNGKRDLEDRATILEFWNFALELACEEKFASNQ